MNKQETLAQLVYELGMAFNAAEDYAKENSLDFSFYPAYGMGGYFDGEYGEWHSSTEGCQ